MATVTPYKRELPFIHRTWKSAVDSLSQYGRKLTTANGDSPVNGDEGPRMAKRRRLDDDSLESALNGAMDHLLPETLDDFEKVFRVQVLKIIRNGTPAFQAETLLNIAKSPAKKDTPSIRIRCRLTIYWYKDRPHREYRALYSDNQICTIKVFQDGDDPAPMARVYLATPFHIPAEKIYVERDDGKGFGLDDCYMIGVELESAGDPRWPPQDLLPKADAYDGVPDRRQHWVLSTQFIYRFDKHRWTSPVKLRKRAGEDLPTDFRIDTDLRWSTGHPMGTKAKLGLEDSPPDIKPSSINGALEPLTNGHVNGRVEHLANGYAKDAQDVMMMDDDEEPEEATTPSRSLRHREKQNYNLKLLSDKARGKERKERKRRKAAEEAEAEMKAGQVIWILPQAGRVISERFACLRCFAEHTSMAQLKEHLECHTDYKHSYPPSGNFVVISPHDQPTPRISKSYLIDHQSHRHQSVDDHESDLEEQASPPKPRRSHSRSKTQQVSSAILHKSANVYLHHYNSPWYHQNRGTQNFSSRTTSSQSTIHLASKFWNLVLASIHLRLAYPGSFRSIGTLSETTATYIQTRRNLLQNGTPSLFKKVSLQNLTSRRFTWHSWSRRPRGCLRTRAA